VTDDNAIEERRQQWQRLSADERIKRVRRIAADVAAYARWRKAYLKPRRRTNDFLFID